MRTAIALGGAILLSLGAQRVLAAVDCEPARCAVQTELAACPCDSANHGRYVSCVAHVVNSLSRMDPPLIPTNCKGKVKRCAARSTCGKPGFVVCDIPTGTCDPVTLTCVGSDPPVACDPANPLSCGSKCKIKSTEERCLNRGGIVNTSSTTCCAACGP
jgi:hypothetical protein